MFYIHLKCVYFTLHMDICLQFVCHLGQKSSHSGISTGKRIQVMVVKWGLSKGSCGKVDLDAKLPILAQNDGPLKTQSRTNKHTTPIISLASTPLKAQKHSVIAHLMKFSSRDIYIDFRLLLLKRSK